MITAILGYSKQEKYQKQDDKKFFVYDFFEVLTT